MAKKKVKIRTLTVSNTRNLEDEIQKMYALYEVIDWKITVVLDKLNTMQYTVVFICEPD
jgi:hypothetical protein